MRVAIVMLLVLDDAAAPLPGHHANGPSTSTVPLVQALVEGDKSLAEALIDGGADVNARDVITPLYAAQEYLRRHRERHSMLRKLLRAGARVDAATNDGSTTLMLAAYNGDVRSAEILVDHGADPLRTNDKSVNSIDAATHGGHLELAEMLRETVGESGLRHRAPAPEAKVEL